MPYVRDLITIRDDLTATLAAEATRQKTTPKPTVSAGGRTMTWESWRAQMMLQIKDANQAIINAGGATEVHTAVYG